MLRRSVRSLASWRLCSSSSSYHSVSGIRQNPIIASAICKVRSEKDSHYHHCRRIYSSSSSDAIQVALDSVVKIFTVSTSPNYLLPWQNKSQRETMGSGFVIHGRKILTNAHVVADQSFVLVRKHGSPNKYRAQVKAVGHECDLAILEVENEDFWDGVHSLELGHIPLLQEAVAVVGYPQGNIQSLYKLLSTAPISESLNLAAVSELIEKQHWSELKTHYLKDSDPTKFLRQLLESELDPDLTLRYFNWSHRELRVSHTLDLTCKLLHALAKVKRYPKIRAFLDAFVKRNKEVSNFAMFHFLSLFESGFYVSSIIVDMLVLAYVRNLKIQLGFEAYQRACDYGFRLSVLSCNPLLSTLVKGNEIGKMEWVFKQMVKRRVKLDLCTYNIVINGLCKVGKLNKARDVVEDMKSFGFLPDVITFNMLIDGYCKMGKYGKMFKAKAVLKEMVEVKVSPNEVTYNILIDGFCKDENVSGAVKVFKEMQKEGLKPNLVSYNSLINGFCCEGKVEEACSLKEEMISFGLKPNVVTCNALMKGFCNKKMINEAILLMDNISNQGLVPNVVTYNTLIDSYCKNGMMDEAFQLRSLMSGKGVSPDVSTYNCLISGFCRHGNIEKARDLMEEMRCKGLSANLITYNILIDAYCKKRETRNGRRILKDITMMGLKPSHLTYNTLMDGFCREGNLKAALSVREQMEKDRKRPNVATYNVLIKGYCEKCKLEEANRLLNEMLEKGLVPNRVTYEIVREEMMDKGFVPDIEGHLCNISSS